MVKYTEEQLLEAREEAYVPSPQILEAFNQMIDQVKEHAAAEYEKHKALKWSNGDTYIDEHGHERSYHHMNRRRASRTGGSKPNLRKKSEVDQDGWETLSKPKKSFGAEEGVEERNKFRETIKARPNNKNLGSSKPVDHREIIADKPVKAFNAFAALEDDDDDEE
ncbi:uncharacterized protein SPAPADRAFT_62869 [Spathaspora passalidarum NRRL Y-27907]|uniref:Cap-associated protein CAF20 n=1 Tax=Spathaspora passalidarum (strain NRRL Y-27907 / 11-Y1) TaxID=619300 RepID=G3ATJ9_SPAPN|nr:uncharacterized protein SPAPADRAFT_62869 [Spathaspora passalidarum NRRL Y-27907]EGW30962.1 hypothetical protein SPAPADRAFT_62869 [Spathaspora passalidarum NRRL Y-27907]